MALRTKLVTHGSGYTLVRELTPNDQTIITELIGDKKDDVLFCENVIIAQSIVYHEVPLENLKEEEYLIPHPTTYENWIEVEDFEAKKLKNGEYPKKKILDPNRPYNFIVDPNKVKRIQYQPADSVDKLMLRQNLGLADWYVVGQASMRLNEPNPVLLGK